MRHLRQQRMQRVGKLRELLEQGRSLEAIAIIGVQHGPPVLQRPRGSELDGVVPSEFLIVIMAEPGGQRELMEQCEHVLGVSAAHVRAAIVYLLRRERTEGCSCECYALVFRTERHLILRRELQDALVLEPPRIAIVAGVLVNGVEAGVVERAMAVGTDECEAVCEQSFEQVSVQSSISGEQ